MYNIGNSGYLFIFCSEVISRFTFIFTHFCTILVFYNEDAVCMHNNWETFLYEKNTRVSELLKEPT